VEDTSGIDHDDLAGHGRGMAHGDHVGAVIPLEATPCPSDTLPHWMNPRPGKAPYRPSRIFKLLPLYSATAMTKDDIRSNDRVMSSDTLF
jgi:hypothetical protein